MREPDLHYETGIHIDLEDATQNLSENLHFKWNYALLYIDKYSDENGMPVSSISGLRRDDETQYYMRIQLITEQKSVYCRVDIWRVITTGWPFPTGVTSPSSSATDKMVDIVDDILEFAQTPYENTGGVFTWLRNIFTGKLETRDYKE